ncbi:MAG: hypothetical protein M1821_003259 [Bathelium mastoideum]|nr:MAG: hypothetical protein M1821_003259 [Bathelium mastoideum]
MDNAQDGSNDSLQEADSGIIKLTITHHGQQHVFSLSSDSTIADLSHAIEVDLSVPASNQKLMIPKLGLLRPPFPNPDLPISSLTGKKITLMGATAGEASAISTAGQAVTAAATKRREAHAKYAAKPTHRVDPQRVHDDATYTFHTLRPLPYLPGPERSLRFLERLRDDAGIRAAMRRHRFAVGLLTEMDPAMHTTHESRTLGLNRNRGEVIELRLRTDAYDGYRDYATIRKTLCHELTHNVWGEHDRNFWELCKEIEKEVGVGDWRSGGRSVGNEEYAEGEEVADHGGWQGGEYVLGGTEGGNQGGVVVSSASGGEVGTGGLSRREIMARAAEERLKKQKEAERTTKDDSTGSA